jgi:hypothetical protein
VCARFLCPRAAPIPCSLLTPPYHDTNATLMPSLIPPPPTPPPTPPPRWITSVPLAADTPHTFSTPPLRPSLAPLDPAQTLPIPETTCPAPPLPCVPYGRAMIHAIRHHKVSRLPGTHTSPRPYRRPSHRPARQFSVPSSAAPPPPLPPAVLSSAPPSWIPLPLPRRPAVL